MAIHLQETFGWPVVHAYHTAWIQCLEQSRATWDDEATKPEVSVNSCTPSESFLRAYKKIHLPSPPDLCDLIHKASKECFLFLADVARAYRQLPLDPGDWPLVCVRFQGAYYTDISLPFGMCLAAVHFKDDTSIITRELNRNGSAILS